jgi:hypothetical protein
MSVGGAAGVRELNEVASGLNSRIFRIYEDVNTSLVVSPIVAPAVY